MGHVIISGLCVWTVYMWSHIIGTWHLLLHLMDGRVCCKEEEFLEKAHWEKSTTSAADVFF